MLWTLVVILLVLWLLGLVTSYTLGGVIHVLLVIALVVIVINVLQGRRALWRPGNALCGNANERFCNGVTVGVGSEEGRSIHKP
jgi:hypothetical protein